MEVELGNAKEFDPSGTGWIVGYGDWLQCGSPTGSCLRYMNKHSLAHGISIKWMDHPKNDPKGSCKPVSEGRSISFLVSVKGKFRIKFCEDANFRGRVESFTLKKHGDFVAWGEGLYHRWHADEASTILTVRWIPILPSNA